MCCENFQSRTNTIHFGWNSIPVTLTLVPVASQQLTQRDQNITADGLHSRYWSAHIYCYVMKQVMVNLLQTYLATNIHVNEKL